MTNDAISDNFSLLGKLIDIHRDDSFKAKIYTSVAFTIEKLPEQLANFDPETIANIKGIGKSTSQKILEQLQTGELSILKEYIAKTPPGILEMLQIKGIGPKKIASIWKDLEIETVGELLYACDENRLMLYKGFGEKTQQNVKESIEFYLGTLGSYLYQQIENFAYNVSKKLPQMFAGELFEITGAFKRQLEIIEKLEWVTTCSKEKIELFFTTNGYSVVTKEDNYIMVLGNENVSMGFYITPKSLIINKLFTTSCSESFLNEWERRFEWKADDYFENEEAIFAHLSLPFIPNNQRENAEIIIQAVMEKQLPKVIEIQDIKGIVHSHSTWSDGSNTLDEMAKACIQKGFEYLVISDHSKTAFYAQGLSVEKVLAQHQQIDELNSKYKPFRIFKSIESDILNDGSLDYDNTLLSQFDIVIASIHSNLKMTEEKAMMRLLKAIENPFTSILGHLTGRLLLSRAGYPINHKKIIEACVANNVVIELNAHPRRLDIDWRWIHYALEKNVLISINPDAHHIDGYADCKYGVLVAQKAGLTAQNNLSSFSLNAFENFVQFQKSKR